MKVTITMDDGQVLTGTVAPQVQAKEATVGDVDGGFLGKPLEGHHYEKGVTLFHIAAEAGKVYTFEAIPDGGYGSGSVTIVRPEGDLPAQAIVNGFCTAFPAQAQADEVWTVRVECSAPGALRYIL